MSELTSEHLDAMKWAVQMHSTAIWEEYRRMEIAEKVIADCENIMESGYDLTDAEQTAYNEAKENLEEYRKIIDASEKMEKLMNETIAFLERHIN